MADKLCLSSRGSIPQLIGKAYVEQKAIIRQRLHDSLSLIHFSIDMWTAPTHTGYQAIVAHFVDADARQISKALLALVEHKGSHGGEPQAKAFLGVMDDYDLRTKIGYFTSDNHPSNDKMLRHIAEQILSFNAVKRRIRCNGHIINLAVQAFLFTIAVDSQANGWINRPRKSRMRAQRWEGKVGWRREAGQRPALRGSEAAA
jgi:hypothetical protein